MEASGTWALRSVWVERMEQRGMKLVNSLWSHLGLSLPAALIHSCSVAQVAPPPGLYAIRLGSV